MDETKQSLPTEGGSFPAGEKGREHALFLNLIVATVPAIPKLAAALLSGSVTLFTSGMKTVNEAAAILVAWIISKRLHTAIPAPAITGWGCSRTLPGSSPAD